MADEHAEISILRSKLDELREEQQRLQRDRDQLEALMTERTAELAASERKYRELVQNANSAIIRWNSADVITFANEYAERLFGYEPGELVGKPVTILISESGQAPHCLTKAIVADPEAFETTENENVTKDGRRLWLSWSNRVIKHDDGGETVVTAVGVDRTEQHELEQDLKTDRQLLRQLATELARAEQRERQRIATFLHEDLAQRLVAIKMNLAGTRLLTNLEEIRRTWKDADASLGEAIEATRNIALELSPPLLTIMGLIDAVKWLTTRFETQYGHQVSFEVAGDVKRLDQDLEVLLFQAVKELLNNVRKHAAADKVSATMHYGPDRITITIADNGKGFDPSSVPLGDPGHFGLLNIRERLGYLGGTLDIDSHPGQGSRITITAPIREDNAQDGVYPAPEGMP
ncbi:MAG: PAS domain-containing sensor histidine kinase [Armatimonadota bacterium]